MSKDNNNEQKKPLAAQRIEAAKKAKAEEQATLARIAEERKEALKHKAEQDQRAAKRQAISNVIERTQEKFQGETRIIATKSVKNNNLRFEDFYTRERSFVAEGAVLDENEFIDKTLAEMVVHLGQTLTPEEQKQISIKDVYAVCLASYFEYVKKTEGIEDDILTTIIESGDLNNPDFEQPILALTFPRYGRKNREEILESLNKKSHLYHKLYNISHEINDRGDHIINSLNLLHIKNTFIQELQQYRIDATREAILNYIANPRQMYVEIFNAGQLINSDFPNAATIMKNERFNDYDKLQMRITKMAEDIVTKTIDNTDFMFFSRLQDLSETAARKLPVETQLELEAKKGIMNFLMPNVNHAEMDNQKIMGEFLNNPEVEERLQILLNTLGEEADLENAKNGVVTVSMIANMMVYENIVESTLTAAQNTLDHHRQNRKNNVVFNAPPRPMLQSQQAPQPPVFQPILQNNQYPMQQQPLYPPQQTVQTFIPNTDQKANNDKSWIKPTKSEAPKKVTFAQDSSWRDKNNQEEVKPVNVQAAINQPLNKKPSQYIPPVPKPNDQGNNNNNDQKATATVKPSQQALPTVPPLQKQNSVQNAQEVIQETSPKVSQIRKHFENKQNNSQKVTEETKAEKFQTLINKFENKTDDKKTKKR